MLPIIVGAAAITAIAYVLDLADAHGHLTEPPPRGTLAISAYGKQHVPVDWRAPTDYEMHFPAGDRGKDNAGLRSQERKGRVWTPFEPLSGGFKWRSGVCGDLKGRIEDHRRDGKFFYNATITRTYISESVVNFEASLVGHHNGFFEFHLCDTSKCRGDISEHCFRIGACKRLERAWVTECEEDKSKICAPIDRFYNGRYYVPCPKYVERNRICFLGLRGEMMYKLPKGMTCEHCVLHWLYAAGNKCNPVGVANFYNGLDRPSNWGNCIGDAGARGGYASYMRTCGGSQFSQEYFNCADVRIVKRGLPRKDPFSTLQIGLVDQGRYTTLSEIGQVKVIRISKYKAITIRASLKWPVKELEFSLQDGSIVRTFRKGASAPYFMFGNTDGGEPHKWEYVIRERWFTITARADGFQRSGKLFLTD